MDLDLEKFFDRVNHDILMSRIARRIGDKRLLLIIRRYLQAGMMQDGVCVARDEGTPQGGPLSPLLANLLLDDLDRELDSRGHRFCRYADDCNIYVRSLAAGQRVMDSVVRFLEGKLKLRVNREKSAVAPVGERKFLGYRLLLNGKLGISPKSVTRAKEKIRQITRRNRGVSFAQVIVETQFVPDWLAHLLPLGGLSGKTPMLSSQTTQAWQVRLRLPPEAGRARLPGKPPSQFGARPLASGQLPAGEVGHV